MQHTLLAFFLLAFNQYAAAVSAWNQEPMAVPALGPFGLGALAVITIVAAVRVIRQQR